MQKTRTKWISLVLLMPFIIGCSSTRNAPAKSDYREMNTRSMTAIEGEVDLLSMIQRVPGVTVRGNVVRVFGPNSFSNQTEPLFLINGAVYSGGLSGILTSVNPQDVRSIEVYKTPTELALYGARGANGVINIILKD